MTSPDKNITQSIDEVEDLTRFADESFDTDEVDLFEFTGEDDSPLTRLKSVVLSLDWEINDDILDELAVEVADLRSKWENDKVAQVYLQGLEKVGKYLQAEGAYAHPNAIKLLLTLFYDFEKITSSPDISGEDITSLLKSDIRKFKVLQFQISMKDSVPARSSEDQEVSATGESETAEPECEPLDCIHATILGLEWEVTDEGLEKFNRQADELREDLLDNKYAQVLLQGLQALGAYICEEKAQAHPDAFTLLHSFYDGLKALVTDKNLDSEKRQEILIDRVSRLNSLKEIIAATRTPEPVERSVDEVDQVLDLESAEVEPDAAVTEPSADEKEATLDAEKAEISLADDELHFDIDSEDYVTEDQPAGEQEFDEKMDTFASLSGDDGLVPDLDDKATADSVNAALETADEQYPEEILDPDAIQPVSDEIADDFIEEELRISTERTLAFDESEESAGLAVEAEDEALGEEGLEEQLELFFSDEKESEQAILTDADSVEAAFADLELSFDEEEDLRPESDEELVTPALADTDEEGGFTEEFKSAEPGEESTADLEEQLDSFFDFSEDDELAPALTEEDDLSPALADTDEEVGFSEELVTAELEDDSSGELQDKLDSFFGSIDEEMVAEVAGLQERESGAEEIPAAPEEELDSFFTEAETPEADQEADDVIPALADTEESAGFDEKVAVTGLADTALDEIDDKLDSFFKEDKEETAQKVPAAITTISSLAAVAATLTTAPAPDDFKQVSDLIAAAKEENPTAQQTVLLTLIDSAANLLSKKPEAAAGSSAIVQELVAGFEDSENPATLVEAVSRYTSWQQDFFDTIISSQESTGPATSFPAADVTGEDVILQLQADFSQLRDTLMKEFDSLKKELKKE